MFRFARRRVAGPNTAALGIGALMALGLGCVPAVASPSYTITDLGTLGGPTSYGYAINKHGDTTGRADVSTETNDHHAYINNGTTDLDLGTLSGGAYSSGMSINKNSVVVGVSQSSSGFNHAFIYVTSPMTDLGTLPGGMQSMALGVNDTNEVCGSSTDSGGQFHAFYYTGGAMHEVPTGTKYYSQADAIGDDGKVVGTFEPTAGTQHAFTYSIVNVKFADIGTLTGEPYAEAFGVNASNVVVGGSGAGSGESPEYGFKYTGGKMKKLPSLGGTQTVALAINDSNQTVGYSYTKINVSHAFTFLDGVMTDLNTLIDTSSGWVLTTASGINDDGQIVGTGTLNGTVHGYMLTPVSAAADSDAVSGPPPPPATADLDGSDDDSN